MPLCMKVSFDKPEKQSEYSYEGEVKNTCVEKRPDKPSYNEILRCFKYLGYHNNPCERGVFYESNNFVRNRWKNSFYDLQKNDFTENPSFCKSQNLSGFVLSFRYAFNSAAVYFRKIARIVYNESNADRDEPR